MANAQFAPPCSKHRHPALCIPFPSPYRQASAFIRQFDMDGDDRINFDEYLLFQVRELAFLLNNFVYYSKL